MARARCPPGPVTPASCTGQADQAGSAGGCLKTWAWPTDRLAGQPGRRQPNRRSGRDPGSRPYARIQPKPGKPGRKHYPQAPCRIGAGRRCVPRSFPRAQIARFCGGVPPLRRLSERRLQVDELVTGGRDSGPVRVACRYGSMALAMLPVPPLRAGPPSLRLSIRQSRAATSATQGVRLPRISSGLSCIAAGSLDAGDGAPG